MIKDLNSLPIRYFNQTTASTNTVLQNAYRVVFGGEFVFDAWFEDFLLGLGTPCPTLLNSAKDRFSSVVKLEDISESTFRLRSFAWAISGVPRRILDYLKLELKTTMLNMGLERSTPRLYDKSICGMELAPSVLACAKCAFLLLILFDF
ncbi:hypothetical protein F5879DRAFT_923121 [Lentinula edodes]|nr:hypothetical protein F5879DRAFT_923121 [Lentinula edodes]